MSLLNIKEESASATARAFPSLRVFRTFPRVPVSHDYHQTREDWERVRIRPAPSPYFGELHLKSVNLEIMNRLADFTTYCVISKPSDVSFISGVQENRFSLIPVFHGDKITLQKGSIVVKVEVIQLRNCNRHHFTSDQERKVIKVNVCSRHSKYNKRLPLREK